VGDITVDPDAQQPESAAPAQRGRTPWRFSGGGVPAIAGIVGAH
jgi:hypothetical protein